MVTISQPGHNDWTLQSNLQTLVTQRIQIKVETAELSTLVQNQIYSDMNLKKRHHIKITSKDRRKTRDDMINQEFQVHN